MSAHKWAEVIKAWAEGEAIQWRMNGDPPGVWLDYKSRAVPGFNGEGIEWRIKPDRWYRVAILEYYGRERIFTVVREDDEEYIKNSSSFIRWLTDRVYY